MKNVLITGAGGFVGRNLASYLAIRKDVNLTLFSRSFPKQFWEQQKKPSLRLVEGCLTNIAEIRKVVQGQDFVFHLVTTSVPASSWDCPTAEVVENLLPTLEFFKICANERIHKLVFLSSGGTVYGKTSNKVSEKSKLMPFSPHGIVKASLEYYLEYFRVAYSLKYHVFRASNLYGPGQYRTDFGVINTWLNNIQRGLPLVLYGNGNQIKDYLFIEDAVYIIAQVLSSQNFPRVINLSTGKSTSLNDLVTLLKTIIPDFEVKSITKLDGDNRQVILDNSLLKKCLPYFQFTSLEDGINKTWQWLQKTKMDS